MTKNHTVRRVNKRTYDKYNVTDYNLFTDNLNPINPTVLEDQYTELLQAVQKKVIEAYEKAKISPPKDLFDPELSPATMLNDVDSLINKLKRNPLSDLYGNLNSIDSIAPFISASDKANDILNNPLKLDCSGIESTLKVQTGKVPKVASTDLELSADDSEEEGGESSGDSEVLDNGNSAYSESNIPSEETSNASKIKITYVGLESTEDKSKYPTEILESECPVNIAIPTEAPTNKVFAGWYYDSLYNQKLLNGNLDWPGKNVTLYALFKESADDDDSGGAVTTPTLDPVALDDVNDCDLIDLAFLKIILIIIIVAKVLITVLVLVCNIMKAAADIAKDAQLCWINPPSLQSLIAYVMQRLGAIIFQLLGMILLKLWSLLNLDCISKNTVNTIDQINAALAGMIDLLGSVDSLAMNFSDSTKGMWQTILDTIRNLGDQLKDQAGKVWDDITSVGDNLKAAGKDIADTYTNPATYINAVPPEIRETVMQDIDALASVKDNITRLKATINNLTNRNDKAKNETPKGVETIVFS